MSGGLDRDVPRRIGELPSAPWLRDDVLQSLLAVLSTDGGMARVVGGAVRNTLMGLDVGDVDIATDLVPDEVSRRAQAAGFGVAETGLSHGTVTVHKKVSGTSRAFEVTTLRRDVETDGRRAVVSFTEDWAEDASRRDFTMNAVYCDREGVLLDPMDGVADIARRRVRFVGDPDSRIAEDTLRVLRFYRFSAQYAQGRIAQDGHRACGRHAGELGNLSRERVRAELLRLLASAHAGPVIAAMAENGVLVGILDIGTHVDLLHEMIGLETRLAENGDDLRRLAGLVGPGAFDPEELKASLVLSNAETRRLEAMRKSMALLQQGTSAPHLFEAVYRYGRTGALDGLLLASLGGRMDEQTLCEAAGTIRSMEEPVMPVQGRDLLEIGIMQGAGMGRILADLETAWIASGGRSGREDLLDMAQRAMPRHGSGDD